MLKASPSDNYQTQPNQRRAKLFVSELPSFFEINENSFHNSNLIENNLDLDINENPNNSNATTSANKHIKSKSFTFEQFDKINIPPNQQEARNFAIKIQNSIDTITIIPDSSANKQNTQSNNIDYGLSNLHILFAKDDYHPAPFHVSPITSISSPFNKNLIFDQTITDDESKFQISNDSVAYRQCIDIELNKNFEFSEISSFSADLIKNTIEETQNVEIFDTNEATPISIDSSYELFERGENSINHLNTDNQLSLSQLSSFENENKNSHFYTKEAEKSIKIPKETITYTKSIQTQNFQAKSKPLKFVKQQPINLINKESPKSNKNDDYSSNKKETKPKENKKFVALISDPIHYSTKGDDSLISLPIKTPSIFSDKNQSLEFHETEKNVPQNLTNNFALSPIESFELSILDAKSENSQEIALSDGSFSVDAKILNKNNELKICSVSHIDFNEPKKIIPSFEASEIETIISLEKEKKNENDLDLSQAISTSSINISSKLNDDSDSNNSKFSSQNITPRKKRIPRFTTSDLSTMANIRYSPQIENLKNSSSIFTESENTLNLSFQESEVSTMTSIDYIPVKMQVQESLPLSIETTNQNENDSSSEQEKSTDFTKKQLPVFTTSELSTMANVRHSPQKDVNNLVLISSYENEPSYLENSNQNLTLDENDYKFSIEESEIMKIISINYDPSISQELEDQQQQKLVQKSSKENEPNVDFKSSKKSSVKIRNDAPNFSTSDLSTMANIRYSPKNTYSDFSNEIDSISNDSENEVIKESEIVKISSRKYVPNQKQQNENSENSNIKSDSTKKQKTKPEKQIPVFSTSESSTMTNLFTTNSTTKLEESQISSIEINDENENKLTDDQITIQTEEEEEEKDGPINKVNINESELTTITSINYVPYQNQQKNILFLSNQIIVENNFDDANTVNKEQTNKSNSRTKGIIKTKPRNLKRIPEFSTSEPLSTSSSSIIMIDPQSNPQKRKLKESDISFIEINDLNNNELSSTNEINLKSIEIEEEEERDDVPNTIDINQSELTTITSIDYVPYQNQQKNILFLSNQIIVENNFDNTNTVNKKQTNKSNSRTKGIIKTKPRNLKRIPEFSTSEPLSTSSSSIIMIDQQSNPQKRKLKESDISFIEINDLNNNESRSTNEINPKSIEIEEKDEEEKDEIPNTIDINQSELTTITSINYVPYQNQQKNILFISEQNIVENKDTEEKIDSKSPKIKSKKSIMKQKQNPKSKEIPTFTTSELSTTTNHHYSTNSKKKLEESQALFNESYNNESNSTINTDSITIEIEEEEEEIDQISNEININQSELTTITSINYIPYQNQQQQENTLTLSKEIAINKEDINVDNETKSKRKQNKKPKFIKEKQTKEKKIPLFTTSEPSSLTNLQENAEQIHVKNINENNLSNITDKIDNDIDSDSPINIINDQEEVDQNDFNNIEESDLISIVSIKYDSSQEEYQSNLDQKQYLKEENDNDFNQNHSINNVDSNQSSSHFATPKRKDKKSLHRFTTSDTQINSISSQQNDFNPINRQVKTHKKSSKNKTVNAKTNVSLETSELVVISDNSYIPPNKDLNQSQLFTTEIQNNTKHDQIGIQSISNNHSKFVVNEPLTIESSKQQSSIKDKSVSPHFEFSELTTNANIKESNKPSSNVEKKNNNLSNVSTLTDNEINERKSDEQVELNNYSVEKRKDLSQLITFEYSAIQNQLEPSQSIVSESPHLVKKKNSKTSKKADLSIDNECDFDYFMTQPKGTDKTNKNALSIMKSKAFFINNSKPKPANDDNSNDSSLPKKKTKPKDVKSTPKIQTNKEQFQLERAEISVQTSNTNNSNKNADSHKTNKTSLSPSSTFYIETSEREQKSQSGKKKKQPKLQQSDTQNQPKEETESKHKEDKSNPILTLSDSLTCDDISNQDLPQFEQSLITTISNISMIADEPKQSTFHLSFQQNPSLAIKQNEKKNPVILFNSQSEAFQSIHHNEDNNFSVENNQLSILPELKPNPEKTSRKELTNDQTQTELNTSIDEISKIDLSNIKDKSIKAPKFESSDPTTILSLDQKETTKQDKYLQTSTQISNDSVKENSQNLETSLPVSQNFAAENAVLTKTGIKTVVDYQSNNKKDELKLTSNEVVFENEKSPNSRKTQLVLQQQFQLSQVDHSKFEINEPSTITSIQFEANDSNLDVEDKIKDCEINKIEKKTKKETNLSMSKNYDVFENTTQQKTAEKIHFDLSEITNVTDISEFNSNIQNKKDSTSLNFDQNLNKFTITGVSKEFHESSPVSIFSSNKEDHIETSKKQIISNDYENQVLFEQKPERKQNKKENKSSNSINFEQSDLISILSIHEEQNDDLNTNEITREQPSHNETKEMKQSFKNSAKNIEITEFYQKVDPSYDDKITCKESEPLTLVSIQNKKVNHQQQPSYELTSNLTIFENKNSPQKRSIDGEIPAHPMEKNKPDFEVTNFVCFEKSVRTSMTKVFGSLYLKPESESPKAKLSLNQDSQFYFEENNNNEIKSPMKTSRSLENLDSFTIVKERNPMTMIFGSFSVQNDKKESSEQRTESSSQTSSSMQKKQNFNTVFGCFEIQSPSIEKVENSMKENDEKNHHQTTKGTNCSLNSHANVSTSTENNQQSTAISDGFDKKDSFSGKEKNSLSLTKAFGRFDISPGTYNSEKNSEIRQKSLNDDDSRKVSLSFENSESILIENDKTKNQPLSKENEYFYVNNQLKEENKTNNSFKPILMLEDQPLSIQVENDQSNPQCDFYSNEIADIERERNENLEKLPVNVINIEPSNNYSINKENKANLEKLSLNTINIEPTKESKENSEKHSLNTNNIESTNDYSINKENKTNLEKISLNTINIEPSNENKANLEKLSLNTVNIEPTNDYSINKESKPNLEKLSLNTINIEPTIRDKNHLSIGKNSPSINLPDEPSSSSVPFNYLTKDHEVELHECQNVTFEVPNFNDDDKNMNLLLNQSEFQIQPNLDNATISEKPNSIQREIENKSVDTQPMKDDQTIQNHHYEDEKNVEIKTSFPLFYEYLNNSKSTQNLNISDDDDFDIEQKMQFCSITNSSPFFIAPEMNLNTNHEIEEEEEEKAQNNEADFNSPIFSNIDLCKKLISRQMKEIKSLEKENVKKDVAFDSLNKKFELFKESTKKMLSKHFGEIRSLNETNAKLASQIDSLQQRLESKNDAVFTHLKQKTANCSIYDANEIFSIEPMQIEKSRTFNNVLVTVTVEDLEPSILQMENLLQSSNISSTFVRNNLSRRLFISNPFYEETGLLNNLSLLRESGKITQVSLLPKSSFIPLKVDTNLNFEKKEVKPSLSFSFYHLRVTRPKFFSNLHLEDNLTVAHILPQKISKNNESNYNSSSKSEMRRNIERSQIFLPGDDDLHKQGKKSVSGFNNLMIQSEMPVKKLSYYIPNSLYIEPEVFYPKLAIKKTQAISFIAHKKQK